MSFQSPPHQQFADPTILLAHFIRQIGSQHVRTATQEPIMLHYDSKTGGMVEYPWPISPKTGERVPPGQLEEHRRSHEFRGPNCLCSFLEGKGYTEAEFGIVEVGGEGPQGGSNGILSGEYIAICAKRRCGFFLCLERFYYLNNLREEHHPLRTKPLPLDLLIHASDVDKTYRRDGLFQMIPGVVLRGRRRGLESVDPKDVKAVEAKAVADLMLGVPEDTFWETFVQCVTCGNVQFRQHYSVNHRCPPILKGPGATRPLRRHHPYPAQRFSETQSRQGSFYAYMNAIIGDIPAQRPTRGRPPRLGSEDDVFGGRKDGQEDEDGCLSDDLATIYTTATDDVTSSDSPPPLFGYAGCKNTRQTPGGEDGGLGSPCPVGLNGEDRRGVSNFKFEFPAKSSPIDLYDEADNSGGSTDEEEITPLDLTRDEGPSLASGEPSSEGDEESQGLEAEEESQGLEAEEESQGVEAFSDDLDPPAARTSDMEKWPSLYDSLGEAIARINGPHP